MPISSFQRGKQAAALLLFAFGLLACGDQAPATAIPANHKLYGRMAPVRIFLIDEHDAIRLKAECSTDQFYDSLEFRYRYAHEAQDQTIAVPYDAYCVPGALIYESNPQSALPLGPGDMLSLRITVRYRNGSTSSMTRAYSRGVGGELIAEN